MTKPRATVRTGGATTHRRGIGDEAAMLESGERFKRYVRSAMKERGLTMAALGRESGIEPTVIYSWFRGQKKPRRTTLRPVGDALKLTPDQMLAVWNGERPPARRGATEAGDPVAQAINALVDRLERLEAAQVEGFDAVLEAIAAAIGGPERTGTSRGSGHGAPSGTPG